MSEKFCTTCQVHRNEANGKHIWRGKIRRWICNECEQKRSESFISKDREKIRNQKRGIMK